MGYCIKFLVFWQTILSALKIKIKIQQFQILQQIASQNISKIVLRIENDNLCNSGMFQICTLNTFCISINAFYFTLIH